MLMRRNACVNLKAVYNLFSFCYFDNCIQILMFLGVFMITCSFFSSVVFSSGDLLPVAFSGVYYRCPEGRVRFITLKLVVVGSGLWCVVYKKGSGLSLSSVVYLG